MHSENNDVELSVVVPILNEEKNLNELFERLSKTLINLNISYEIIFCDNLSKDNSRKLIKRFVLENKNKVTGVFLSKNFGHQSNLRSGISLARGKVLVTLDGDLQDPPELIEKLYHEYKNSLGKENFEIINAKRSKRHGESALRMFLIKSFYIICRLFITKSIQYNVGDYRLMTKKVYSIINMQKNYNLFLRSFINEIGFAKKTIVYERQPRIKEKSKMSFYYLLKDGINAIVSSSNRLLRLIPISSIFFLFTLIVLNLIFNISLILNLIIMFIILFFFISILSEYIANVYNELKGKKPFIIDEIIK